VAHPAAMHRSSARAQRSGVEKRGANGACFDSDAIIMWLLSPSHAPVVSARYSAG
jgi:hypothetical protein